MRLLGIVGTDHHRFTRFVRWIDAWSAGQSGVECLIQYGTADPPTHARGAAYLDHDELEEQMAAADVIACHGGPSTILEVRRRGLVPIVVPRSPRFGEHVDDHQERFVRRLADSGLVLAAQSEGELVSLLDKAVADPDVVAIPADDTGGQGAPEAVMRFAELVSGLFAPRSTR
ncbi:MAG TPA: glycosyltransferase [Actinopolymorphaceae bacterium]|jgi:UDP-N-acetylglucosamine transferase subunit ALG13